MIFVPFETWSFCRIQKSILLRRPKEPNRCPSQFVLVPFPTPVKVVNVRNRIVVDTPVLVSKFVELHRVFETQIGIVGLIRPGEDEIGGGKGGTSFGCELGPRLNV